MKSATKPAPEPVAFVGSTTFDIELDNQKLPLPLSLLLEGAPSLNGSAIATLDMLGTPPLMDLESSEMIC